MGDRPDLVPPELQALLSGDASDAMRDEAWAAFVARHSRLVMTVARSVTPEHDVMMDAYAYVLDRLREDSCRRLRAYVYDGRSAFTTWLVVVAQRMCVDHYRRRYGRAPRGHGDTAAAHDERGSRRRLLDFAVDLVDLSALVDDRSPLPDAALRAAERDDALAGALVVLAPADRLLLKLRFEDDLPAREIATIMEFPSVFHVYRRLTTVCAQLRRLLAARGVEESLP